jgi:hypothetical protein
MNNDEICSKMSPIVFFVDYNNSFENIILLVYFTENSAKKGSQIEFDFLSK